MIATFEILKEKTLLRTTIFAIINPTWIRCTSLGISLAGKLNSSFFSPQTLFRFKTPEFDCLMDSLGILRSMWHFPFPFMFLIDHLFPFMVPLKKINLLIYVSNTIDKNIESRVIKTLEDDTTFMLIIKMIDSRLIYLIIQ